MANHLFRLDLSDGAEDFQKTATEPGLAMLDASGANHATLNRWLGDYAAEPVWLGPDSVSYYVRHEGERVAEPTLAPVTASDLERGLKEDWEALQSKLRKARPETASEQTLQRVATKTLREIAADPDANDVSCFLFKYRANGRPWKLVWCWGFQRHDTDPARGLVCRNKQCEHLFAHRQGKRAICPVCKKVTAPTKSGGFLAKIGGLPVATALLALAVLLLLLLLFSGGTIQVEPKEWKGPYGSEVALKVNRTRYFLFTSDVTSDALVTSNDPRVVDIEDNVGHANGVGQTTLVVRVGDKIADVPVVVTPAKPTVAITIEPKSTQLMVGSTERVRVIGETEDGNKIDITEKTTLSIGDPNVAMLHEGLLQGAKTGKTKLVASYRENAFAEEVRAEIDVDVVGAKLTGLSVSVEPSSLKLAQYGDVKIQGQADNGKTYDFNGSTSLALTVAPEAVASFDEERLRARNSGEAKVVAKVGDIEGAGSFTVTSDGLYASGEFDVAPREIALSIYEYFRVNLMTNDLSQVTATSSNPKVVTVLDNEHIVGKSPGSATITYKLGNTTKTLKVTVGGVSYETIFAEHDRIIMRPGQRRLVRLYGTTANGVKVELAPSTIVWESQPLTEYVMFDRKSGYLTAIAPTPRTQRLSARIGDSLLADVLVDVVGVDGALVTQGGGSSTALLELNSGFVPHPPVTVHDLNTGRYIGRGIVFRDGRLTISKDLARDHILVRRGLRPGMRISGVNGIDFSDWDEERIRQYFLENPLARDDRLVIVGDDGAQRNIELAEQGQLIEEVKIASASYHAEGDSIYAKIQLAVADTAEYRVIAPGSSGDEPFTPIESGLSLPVQTKTFAKPENGNIKLVVERKMGEIVKRFIFDLKLPDDSLIQ